MEVGIGMKTMKVILIALMVPFVMAMCACSGTPDRGEEGSSIKSESGDQKAEDIIGTATMRSDRTIELRLWTGHGTGGPKGQTMKTCSPGHPDYDDIIDHVGGLRPGETKNVPSWTD